MKKHQELTKANINQMVIIFYKKILQDKLLAPFFIKELGDDINNEKWAEHIKLLTSFWSTMVLKDINEYNRFPFAPHANMPGLTKDTFEQWIKLFYETLDSIYEPDVSIKLKDTATIMAKHFQKKLGI